MEKKTSEKKKKDNNIYVDNISDYIIQHLKEGNGFAFSHDKNVIKE